MRRSNKILFIVAASLIGAGMILGIVGLCFMGDNNMALNMLKQSTAEHAIGEDFSDIIIESGNANVFIIPTDEQGCRVVCEETDKIYYTVDAEDGMLKILKNDLRKWYEHIGIFWHELSITVYLPEGEYASLTIEGDTGDVDVAESLDFSSVNIQTDTGDINVRATVTESMLVSTDTGKVDISNACVSKLYASADTGHVTVIGSEAKALTVNTSTGKVKLCDVKCSGMNISTSTGGVVAENVVSEGDAVIRCTTGNVKLIGFDAKLIDVKTSTGDVYGELLSDKIFSTDTSTGKISVPQSEATDSRCKVETATGDIEFKIR